MDREGRDFWIRSIFVLDSERLKKTHQIKTILVCFDFGVKM